MIKILTTLLIGLVAFIGGSKVQDNSYNAGNTDKSFGAISYPTSLDSFTNPSATDSVATVSHSAQHSNANDAIEALQAKLGIGASTAVSNSVLAGNGTGSSGWTTHPTTTNSTITGLGTFNSFISSASSTALYLSSSFSTSTRATSTYFFATNASTTNLSGTSVTGFGLAPCTGSQFIQWTGGVFSCATPAGAGVSINSVSATSTTADANITVATSSTAFTSGQKIAIFANCTVGNNQTRALYVKPTGSATSSALDIARFGDVGADADMTLFGLYTVGANGLHEIYLGDTTGSKNYSACNYPSIMYFTITP